MVEVIQKVDEDVNHNTRQFIDMLLSSGHSFSLRLNQDEDEIDVKIYSKTIPTQKKLTVFGDISQVSTSPTSKESI